MMPEPRTVRVERLLGGLEYGPDDKPITLHDARRAGWSPLEDFLPGKKERALFAVWGTYNVVPDNLKDSKKQWWDPKENHTVTLWSWGIRHFLADAFALKPYASFSGRQPKISTDYGMARMFAPLRIALWARRDHYDYDFNLIKESIRYVVDMAAHSSPQRFSRAPYHLALALARPRGGRNIARARESAVSLLFLNIEDYWPEEREEAMAAGVPRALDLKFFRDYERKIERLEQRRREIVQSLREKTFERAMAAVANADRKVLSRARHWAYAILLTALYPDFYVPHVKKKPRHSNGRTQRRPSDELQQLLTRTMEANIKYSQETMSVLQDPPTFRDICRNLGLYAGLKILADEVAGKR